VLIVAAQTYASLRAFDKTEPLLRKAIEVDPNRSEPFGMLGQMYLSQGRSDQALKEFQTLATRDPKSVGAHTFVGTIYQFTNKRAEAKDAYRRALAIDSRAPVAANNLAWLYAEDNENLDEALQLAQVARNRWPTSADVADTLGWIYFKKGLLPSAIDVLKDAVAKQPKNVDAQYHLGLAFAKNGDSKQARQALEAALQLGPRSPLAAEARETLKQISAIGS
jgi:Flp pilus assembly protein TadD